MVTENEAEAYPDGIREVAGITCLVGILLEWMECDLANKTLESK